MFQIYKYWKYSLVFCHKLNLDEFTSIFYNIQDVWKSVETRVEIEDFSRISKIFVLSFSRNI